MFTLAFKGEEDEQLVFLQWPADRSAKPLARIRWIHGNSCIVRRIGKFLISIERLVAEKSECRTVHAVGPGFCNHVDGCAFRAAVHRRKTLGGNLEFLHGL